MTEIYDPSSEEKKQQIIALGKLGGSLRIERAVHIPRETVAAYLKTAEIAIRAPGGWGLRAPARPARIQPDCGVC